MEKINLIYVIIILVFLFIAIYYYFYSRVKSIIIPQSRKANNVIPEDFRLVYESVYFNSSDGVELSGWFVPRKDGESNTTVIVLNDLNSVKSDSLSRTYFLADYFNVLYFDFRATGSSKGKIFSYGYFEHRDIDAAFEFLKNVKSEESENIVIIGSTFSFIGLLSSRNKKDLNFIIMENPVIDYREFINRYFKHEYGILNAGYFVKKIINVDTDAYKPSEFLGELNSPAVFLYYNTPLIDKSEFNKIITGYNGEKEAIILKVKEDFYKNKLVEIINRKIFKEEQEER